MTRIASDSQERPAALITGASSGIGAEFARKFASLGYDLILTGRRERLLEGLCVELEEKHRILAGYVIGDLSNDGHVKELVDLISRTRNLQLLVNNAGYTRLEFFHEDDIDAQVDMIKVHDVAAVRLTHAAIPILAKQGFRKSTSASSRSGALDYPAIINVSSIAAFQIGARNLMYDATKGFLLNFSESLHLILRNTGIRVQALCPGFTKTDFHAKLGMHEDHPIFHEHRFMSAAKVVDASLKCLKRGKVICIPGWRNRLITFVTRFAPRRLLYWVYVRRRGLGK
jgi:short-subunit dehydrogenase